MRHRFCSWARIQVTHEQHFDSKQVTFQLKKKQNAQVAEKNPELGGGFILSSTNDIQTLDEPNDADTATLAFTFTGTTTFSRYWDIKVTQVPCDVNYE